MDGWMVEKGKRRKRGKQRKSRKTAKSQKHLCFFLACGMSKWIEEDLEEGFRGNYKIDKLLAHAQTQFQAVDVVDLKPFGRSLIIDGLIQSTQVDEFVYHESLVHPSMLYHPNPQTVYIGGGGEGSTAREVLRHKSVTKCVMVDIDGEVVRFCKEHLPENTEAFADPRLELVIDCAQKVCCL